MPNWCENKLTITGPADEVKKFREIAEPLSMERILPTPVELNNVLAGKTIHQGIKAPGWKKVDEKVIPMAELEVRRYLKQYGSKDWYEWAIKNWGTKWDLYHEDLTDKEITGVEVACGVEYRFDTAWGPPIPFFLYLSQTFPALEFHFYFIDFPNFEGEAWLREGKVARDECWGPFDIHEECVRQSSNKGGA